MSTRQAVAAPRRANYETADQASRAVEVFDPDAWHVMNARDDQLIADELMNGALSKKFVYQFDMGGGNGVVSGVSVVGARHLANAYGGIKHRMVSSTQKIGELFTFTSFAAPGTPMTMSCALLPELADEPDFYSVVIEVTDVKTGNSLQVEKRESRLGTKRGGATYEREHYATIAQSKAFRNGVLAIIPQDVVEEWKMRMLSLGEKDVLTASLIDEKRNAVITFATARAIPVDRARVMNLGMAQIAGLSDAARAGVDQFRASAQALGVMQLNIIDETQIDRVAAPRAPTPAAPRAAPQPPAKPAAPARPAAAPTAQGSTPAAPAAASKPEPQREPDPPPAQPEATPEPPAFENYMVDEVGEVISDAITDPLAFVRQFEHVYDTTFPADRPQLLENNDEALTLAAELSTAAAAIVTGLQHRPPAEQEPPAPALMPFKVPEIPMDRGKPSFNAWNEAIKAEVGALNPDSVIAFIDEIASMIATASPAARPKIVSTLVARCAALTITPPPSLAAAMRGTAAAPAAAQQAAPEDSPDAADRAWADQLIADVRKCATGNDARAMAGNVAIKSRVQIIKMRNPAIFAEIDAAFEERIAAGAQS